MLHGPVADPGVGVGGTPAFNFLKLRTHFTIIIENVFFTITKYIGVFHSTFGGMPQVRTLYMYIEQRLHSCF